MSPARLAFILSVFAASHVHAAPVDVQSLLVSTVTVTCRLEESIAFYRDLLGQKVTDESIRDGARVSQYVEIPPTLKVRLVTMSGSGAFPNGEIPGGHVKFMGIEDQTAPICKKAAVAKGKLNDSGVILSHRVANLDEIVARATARGVKIIVPAGTSGSGQSRNAMLIDPNGHIVEVFELPEAKTAN